MSSPESSAVELTDEHSDLSSAERSKGGLEDRKREREQDLPSAGRAVTTIFGGVNMSASAPAPMMSNAMTAQLNDRTWQQNAPQGNLFSSNPGLAKPSTTT